MSKEKKVIRYPQDYKDWRCPKCGAFFRPILTQVRNHLNECTKSI